MTLTGGPQKGQKRIPRPTFRDTDTKVRVSLSTGRFAQMRKFSPDESSPFKTLEVSMTKVQRERGRGKFGRNTKGRVFSLKREKK